MPFEVGNNLGGRKASVWASQADVSDMLLARYTPEEIIALASDTKRMSEELSSFQAIILIQLANALSARNNNDNALERERLLDRVVGKPIQRTEQKISVSIETEEALLEGRRRVAKARTPVEVSYSVVDSINIDDSNSDVMSSSVPDAILAGDAVAVPAKNVEPKPKKLSFNEKMALKELRDRGESL